MALATAFAVVACGSDAGNSAAPAATGSHSAHAGGPSAPPQPLRAGERFVELKMPEAYTPAPPEGGGTDEYRCQVIDPGLTKAAFLTGTQVMPENVAIAHHAIVYAVPPRGVALVREHDAKTPGLGWQCFSGTDVKGADVEEDEPGAAWVDTWAPGAAETLFTQDVGHKLEPGSLLVLQMHYNLLATDGKPAGSDRTAVRLRLTDGTPQTRELVTWPLDAPTDLPCAADESGPLCDRAASIADVAKRFGPEVGGTADEQLEECGQSAPKPGDTQTCDHPVPAPMTLFAGFGHMHMLGRAIKVELNPGTPKAKVVLDVPQFDFDNQRLVKLPSPVEIGPGDTLRVTCTHDAGLRKLLPQLSKLPPRYVVWGDGTSDEMCAGIMTVSHRKS
ncbi:monooxygenase [Kibdelosporangium persicum]|uniref:Copper type II ascorbate-dependent monooxygenase, C-terminal domain n=2 Tax=Kibdelosporangium persicum TaxID=2698649 RepID=A0ABX2F7N1_9PSEU|nr:Copper type II ascorbate-dependent monooxygenase, C-terminal domain [Kibdelosporangium persicum]